MKFHGTQLKHFLVRTQDNYVCYHEHLNPVKSSTIHKSGTTPYPNLVGNSRSKSNLGTLTSPGNYDNNLTSSLSLSATPSTRNPLHYL
jgi:hypothetical protein